MAQTQRPITTSSGVGDLIDKIAENNQMNFGQRVVFDKRALTDSKTLHLLSAFESERNTHTAEAALARLSEIAAQIMEEWRGPEHSTDHISPAIEAQIREIAGRLQIDPAELTRRVQASFAASPDARLELQSGQMMEGLAAQIRADRQAARREQALRNAPAIALLRYWREKDATQDPEEIARRQAELDALKTALDEDRTSDRRLYP